MEHRYTERYVSDLSVLIYQDKLPVAIGRIKNGSRLGIFIETDFANIDCEHQISLELPQSRNSANKLPRVEMNALVIHKAEKGFGVELDIKTQEQTDLFVEILRALYEKPQDAQIFSMAATR